MTLAAGLIVFRFFHYTALMVLFGSALFPLYAAKLSAAEFRWPVLIAAIAALASGILWFAFTAGSMSGSLKDVLSFAVLSLVARETGFGRLWLARLILLIGATGIFAGARASRKRWVAGTALAAVVTASVAWTGHGPEGGNFHAAADALHLTSAAIWIGALAALLYLLLRERRAETIRDALIGFSGIGPAVVSVLLLSGIANGWFLIGPENLLRTLSTSYGVVLAAKIALFAAMLGLAALNRYRLTPRLDASLPSSDAAVQALRWSVLGETALAALVLAAVALLGILSPPSL